jgi:hypothetical protein
MHEPMSPQREAIVRREMADTTYGGTWHIRENTVDGADVWEVTHQGTVLATLPDWGGNLAMEIADAPDNIRQLFASVDQLRAELAEATIKLEIAERQNRELAQAAQCPSVARTFGSQCALPVRHRGDHRNATRNHYWDDIHAVPSTPAVTP